MQVVMIDHTNVQGQSTNYLESLMQGDDNSIVIVSGTHHSSSTSCSRTSMDSWNSTISDAPPHHCHIRGNVLNAIFDKGTSEPRGICVLLTSCQARRG